MATNARDAAALQLDLLGRVGLDDTCLHRIGVPSDAAARLRRRWDGDRLPCVGEAQLACDTCGLAAAVQFRCAGRCEHDCEHGERAAAALLRVIPRVPVRHWVLRLPGVLCSASAIDQRLVRELSREFLAQVFGFVRGRVPAPADRVQCGGVSLVHRTARALVLDVHVHALVLDGGYVAAERGPREFVPMPDEPTMDELAALTGAVRRGLLARWRRRRGHTQDREVWRVAIEQSLVAGPIAATAVRRIKVEGVAPGRPRKVGTGARRDGFGVHVMERIDGAARGSLAALARYLVRAPVALAELGGRGDDRVVQRLSRPFADGSTHVEFSTDELARRLVALTPAGHVHRVSYHGALAPGAAAKWRARPLQLALVDTSHLAPAAGTRRRKRDPWPSPRCDRCGGTMCVVSIDESVDASPIAAEGRSR